MTTWLLAFLLHSTLWLGLAWLSTRTARRMAPQTREAIWYTAMVASLVTPSIQLMASDSFPLLWHLGIPRFLVSTLEPGLLVGEHASRATGGGLGPSSGGVLLGVWISIGGILLLWYAIQVLVIRLRLSRQDIDAGSREAVALRRLCSRAGRRHVPRLTENGDLGSPIAIGFGPLAEICVPTRALHEMDSVQFRAMLGHEIAHLQRLDPIRLGLINLLRRIFFFQPLFRVAAHHLHQATEEQCDEWSATLLDDRLAVARCLTEVAGWILPQEKQPLVAGIARGPSQLLMRVDRLLEEKRPSVTAGRWWRGLGSASVLVITPWLAPGLGNDHRAAIGHETLAETEAEWSRYEAEHRDEAMEAEGEHSDNAWKDSGKLRGEHPTEEHTGTDREHRDGNSDRDDEELESR